MRKLTPLTLPRFSFEQMDLVTHTGSDASVALIMRCVGALQSGWVEHRGEGSNIPVAGPRCPLGTRAPTPSAHVVAYPAAGIHRARPHPFREETR
jgi:hypothetical protein